MTAPHNLYTIPKAQGDITRVVWPAIGLFLMVTLIGFWVATEYVAFAFQASPALGPTMGSIPYLYGPWDVVIWSLKFDRGMTGFIPDTFVIAHVIMGCFALLALILPVSHAYRRTRKISGQPNDLHGSAHWADDAEVLATGLLPSAKNAGGVMLGACTTKKDGQTYYLRHSGPEHILVYAPTRSGKGVGIVIPTLLSWSESVFCYDIKGENWHNTAGFREKVLKQRCIRFAPWDLESARFNPLDEIRIDHNFVKDVMNIATMIVDPDGKGLNDHWAKTGFDLMSGVVTFVKLTERLDNTQRSLATVQAILSDGGPIREIAEAMEREKAEDSEDENVVMMRGFAAVMSYVRDTARMEQERERNEWRKAAWKAAGEAAQSYLNKATNEASGVLSTAMSFLSIYRDPLVARNTAVSDFTLESLVGGPDVNGKPCPQKTSFYMVNPPTDADRLKPLTRLLLNQVVRRLTEKMRFDDTGQGSGIHPYRLLLLIDEFPSLGKLDVFQQALAFIAGYGLKALLIIQSKNQLYKEYTREEAITDNCHVSIAFTANRPDSAEEISKLLGNFTAVHTQRQYSGNRLQPILQHVNTNEQMVARPLLTPDEVRRLPQSDEIVLVGGHAPIYCQKIVYYQDPAFAKRRAVPPPAMSFPGQPPMPDIAPETPETVDLARFAGVDLGDGKAAVQETSPTQTPDQKPVSIPDAEQPQAQQQNPVGQQDQAQERQDQASEQQQVPDQQDQTADQPEPDDDQPF